jgi:hypothetical protein
VGSSSGLRYEPIDIRKLRTFLGSQTMFRKNKMKGSFPMTYNMLKTCTALKNSLIGNIKDILKKFI